MANTPANLVVSILDSQNNQLVRPDSGLDSFAWSKMIALDLTATTGGVTVTPSTFGFATGCSLYAYGSGTANVTIAQASTSQSAVLGYPTATTGVGQVVLGTLFPSAITFTAASGSQPVYVLLLGS